MARRFTKRDLCWLALLAIFAVAPLSWADEGGRPVDAAGSPARVASEARVDINTAGTEELMTIPGIGEAMARRILEWREQHGPFRRVEDLMKVRGIAEKSFEKIAPHIKVAGDQ